MIKFFSWQYLSCNRFVITVSDWGIFVHIRQKALPEKISWIIARKSFSLCASLYVTMQLSSLTDDVDCWTSTLYRMIEEMMEKHKIIRLSVLRQILEQEKITRAGNPSLRNQETLIKPLQTNYILILMFSAGSKCSHVSCNVLLNSKPKKLTILTTTFKIYVRVTPFFLIVVV